LKLGAIAYVSAAADVSAVKVVSINWTESRDSATAAPDSHIQTVLSKYTAALERRDMAAVKRLWPTINGAQVVALRAEFDQTRPVRIELLDPKIDVNGDTAVVMARRRNILMTTSGTTMRFVTMTTLRLRNAEGSWTIEDVRQQAER
jgi:ketosteroid isomerase-like protein